MNLAKAVPEPDVSLDAREGMREARASRYPEIEVPSTLTSDMQVLKDPTEIRMNKTEKALARFRKDLTGGTDLPEESPSPREALEKAVGIIAALPVDSELRDQVLGLLEIAKSVVHTGTVGEPGGLGLTVEDRSDDPNWTPVEVANVRPVEDRVLDNPITELTVEQATDLTQNPDPNPNLPAMELTPGPRVPAPLPATGDVTMPPSHPSTATGREVEGVTKRVTVEDVYDLVLATPE